MPDHIAVKELLKEKVPVAIHKIKRNLAESTANARGQEIADYLVESEILKPGDQIKPASEVLKPKAVIELSGMDADELIDDLLLPAAKKWQIGSKGFMQHAGEVYKLWEKMQVDPDGALRAFFGKLVLHEPLSSNPGRELTAEETRSEQAIENTLAFGFGYSNLIRKMIPYNSESFVNNRDNGIIIRRILNSINSQVKHLSSQDSNFANNINHHYRDGQIIPQLSKFIGVPELKVPIELQIKAAESALMFTQQEVAILTRAVVLGMLSEDSGITSNSIRRFSDIKKGPEGKKDWEEFNTAVLNITTATDKLVFPLSSEISSALTTSINEVDTESLGLMCKVMDKIINKLPEGREFKDILAADETISLGRKLLNFYLDIKPDQSNHLTRTQIINLVHSLVREYPAEFRKNKLFAKDISRILSGHRIYAAKELTQFSDSNIFGTRISEKVAIENIDDIVNLKVDEIGFLRGAENQYADTVLSREARGRVRNYSDDELIKFILYPGARKNLLPVETFAQRSKYIIDIWRTANTGHDFEVLFSKIAGFTSNDLEAESTIQKLLLNSFEVDDCVNFLLKVKPGNKESGISGPRIVRSINTILKSNRDGQGNLSENISREPYRYQLAMKEFLGKDQSEIPIDTQIEAAENLLIISKFDEEVSTAAAWYGMLSPVGQENNRAISIFKSRLTSNNQRHLESIRDLINFSGSEFRFTGIWQNLHDIILENPSQFGNLMLPLGDKLRSELFKIKKGYNAVNLGNMCETLEALIKVAPKPDPEEWKSEHPKTDRILFLMSNEMATYIVRKSLDLFNDIPDTNENSLVKTQILNLVSTIRDY